MPDDHTPEWMTAQPLQEHTPMTPAEAGLELDAPKARPRWAIPVGLGIAAVVVIAVVLVVTRGGDDGVQLVDVRPGTCTTPVVTDLGEAVEEVPCAPGTAEVLAKVTVPDSEGAAHPGDGALDLFGQSACADLADPEALVVAVPSPSAWADGERVVVCTRRR